MNRFDWKWNLADIKQDKDVKVFTTFSCGGGSSMGYKRAGFQVLGNVEIDPKINEMYVKNNHPKYNYQNHLLYANIYLYFYINVFLPWNIIHILYEFLYLNL